MARLVAIQPAAVRVIPRDKELDWALVVSTVHRQMRSIVGPTRDLEDLTQNALEQVLRGAERFEGRAKLSTFTYRICAHVALNHWRWWRRWLRSFDLGIDERMDAPASGADGGDASLVAERRKRLHRALGKLDPVRRLTLTLADLEGLTAAEVAEILECPEPTVRSRLRQARNELSAALRRDPYFKGGES
jgi:RNA polymerase sigma-70 factor (ECF subfamily)